MWRVTRWWVIAYLRVARMGRSAHCSELRSGSFQSPLRREPDSRARRRAPLARRQNTTCSLMTTVARRGFFMGRVSGLRVWQKARTGQAGQSGDLVEQDVWPSSMRAELKARGARSGTSSVAQDQSAFRPRVESTGI